METKQKTPVEKLKDWADLLGFNNGNLQIIIGELEAAELYAIQENRKKDEPKQSQQPLSIAWLSEEEINRWFDINANEPGKMGKNRFRVCVNNIQTELKKRVIDPVEFLNWCNDIEKCDYYPVYCSDNSSPRYYENRINPSDTKTGSELLQIYINTKTK